MAQMLFSLIYNKCGCGRDIRSVEKLHFVGEGYYFNAYVFMYLYKNMLLKLMILFRFNSNKLIMKSTFMEIEINITKCLKCQIIFAVVSLAEILLHNIK